MRELTLDNLRDLARGAALLGTGGGGDPTIGRLLVEAAMAEGGVITLLDPGEVGDDALVIPTAMMGAPTVFIEKIPALLVLEPGSEWVEIDPRIAPAEGEQVLSKHFASAFFGTTLGNLLSTAGCDTVVVTGASTSGCVRATAVDALQHGYRVVVPREAVGDRNPTAHDANLYDIDTKYGDVVGLDDVVAHVEELAGAHAR